jgi:hypothetical protein
MPQLTGKKFRYTVDDQGRCASIYNFITGHEYVRLPGALWKLVYAEGERMERPVFAEGQSFTVSQQNEKSFTLFYKTLKGDDRVLEISLKLIFTLEDEKLSVISEIENHDTVQATEFQLTAFSGIRSLGGAPEKDYIMWPSNQGKRIWNPAFSDLSTYAGFRKYERHDQFHTDLDLLYPGAGSMQWYDFCNDNEGIYVGSHDSLHHTICMHVERDAKSDYLRMGIIRYPFLEKGEKWVSQPTVYAVHEGDWHAGSKIYRKWIDSAGWKAPERPDWAQRFQGWLRVIMKPHHCEINWDYSKIPELYDEAAASGLDTLYLLGWERGGFARLWPDYYLADDLGGEKLLRQGIDYVHSKGGKLLMFLSYYLIDHQSEFYLKEGGDRCTIKSMWGEDVPFAETYCGEGTYRKIGNPAMPMYAACPSVPLWQDKMIASAKYCLDLGADGVLYDIGGAKPIFCYNKDHPHAKPSHSHADKDLKYKGIKDYVKSRGKEKIVLMEHNVDIFGQHMDITHPGGFSFRTEANQPIEMYRYTFPEILMTNREMGEDEDHYKENINYSFVQGLAYDMTIFRCCGSLKDVPRYAAYMKEKIALRKKYDKHLIYGKYIDTDGFSVDNSSVLAKGYRADDGSLAVAAWNRSNEKLSFRITAAGGKSIPCELDGLEAGVYLL